MGDYCASLFLCQHCEREPRQVRATWSAAIYFYLIPAEWTRRMSLLQAWQLQTAEGFVCSIKGFALWIPVGIMNKAKDGRGTSTETPRQQHRLHADELLCLCADVPSDGFTRTTSWLIYVTCCRQKDLTRAEIHRTRGGEAVNSRRSSRGDQNLNSSIRPIAPRALRNTLYVCVFFCVCAAATMELSVVSSSVF